MQGKYVNMKVTNLLGESDFNMGKIHLRKPVSDIIHVDAKCKHIKL
jgi:hypothetical protein